jgi:hypothetical protein
MSKMLTLELTDAMYDAVKEAAEWIASSLLQLLPTREQRQRRLELAKVIDDTIGQIAAKSGRPKEEVAAEWRARYGPKPPPQLTEEEREAAWERLRRHMGAVSSGDPDSANNERIDADLAREYGSTHADES